MKNVNTGNLNSVPDFTFGKQAYLLFAVNLAYDKLPCYKGYVLCCLLAGCSSKVHMLFSQNVKVLTKWSKVSKSELEKKVPDSTVAHF